MSSRLSLFGCVSLSMIAGLVAFAGESVAMAGGPEDPARRSLGRVDIVGSVAPLDVAVVKVASRFVEISGVDPIAAFLYRTPCSIPGILDQTLSAAAFLPLRTSIALCDVFEGDAAGQMSSRDRLWFQAGYGEGSLGSLTEIGAAPKLDWTGEYPSMFSAPHDQGDRARSGSNFFILQVGR